MHENKTGNVDLKINDHTFFFLFSITKTNKKFKSTEVKIDREGLRLLIRFISFTYIKIPGKLLSFNSN